MKNDMKYCLEPLKYCLEKHQMHAIDITLVIPIAILIMIILIMIYFTFKQFKEINEVLISADLFICEKIIKDNISNNEFQEIIKQLDLMRYEAMSNIIYYKDFNEFLSKCPKGQVYTKKNVKKYLNTLNTSGVLNIFYLLDFAIISLKIYKLEENIKRDIYRGES